MMDRRKALTIPLAVDMEDNSGIHWSQFSECRVSILDKQQTNGAVLWDQSQQGVLSPHDPSRMPRVLLGNVWTTKLGQAYLDKNGGRQKPGSSGSVRRSQKGRESHSLKEVWVEASEEPAHKGSSRRAMSLGGLRPGDACHTDLRRRVSLPATEQALSRLCPERRSSHHQSSSEEEEEEVNMVIIGEEEVNGDGEICVRDIGERPWRGRGQRGRGGASKLSGPLCRTRRRSDLEDTGSEMDIRRFFRRGGGAGDSDEVCVMEVSEQQRNGGGKAPPVDAARNCRISVLRSGGRDFPGLAPAHKRFLLEAGRETDLPDYPGITVTLGDDEARTEEEDGGVSPGSMGSGVRARRPIRRSLTSSSNDTPKPSPAEPIVLSSDDEETAQSSFSSVVRPPGGTVEPQRAPPQETQDMPKPKGNIQGQRGGRQDLSIQISDCPSGMELPFSSLYCGGLWGDSNGDATVSSKRITIPLEGNDIYNGPRDQSEDIVLVLGSATVRRYSVWDQEELREKGLVWGGSLEDLGLPPPTVLLLYLSDSKALSIQRKLQSLPINKKVTPPSGPPSPFLLLSLLSPLDGVEGAICRSSLDLLCLPSGAARISDTFQCPPLSLQDSLDLINESKLDDLLLSLLYSEADFDPEEEDEEDDEDAPENHDDMFDGGAEPGSPTWQEAIEEDLQDDELPELETQLKDEEEVAEETIEAGAEATIKDGLHLPQPAFTLCHRRAGESYSVSIGPKPDSNWARYRHQGPAVRLIQFPPPPLKGGLTVTLEDLECLDNAQFLNDVIIDFYLKYVLLERTSKAVADRTHIFSSFFYKQLTRRDNASEDSSSVSAQQRRHQRVKTWTRHVDIFKKDFLFVPVNQEHHWYMVVICFPGLEAPQEEVWNSSAPQSGSEAETSGKSPAAEEACSQEKPNGTAKAAPGGSESVQSETVPEPPPGPLNCTEKTCHKRTVYKRPCILIMDSLKFSLHERVFKLLRDYLQSEWEVRRGSVREFSAEQMMGSHCRVPLQDNSSDCGLYLLQYVESFLQDPVVHFDLPLRLDRWFPRQLVRRKRDEIRDLVLRLCRLQKKEPTATAAVRKP